MSAEGFQLYASGPRPLDFNEAPMIRISSTSYPDLWAYLDHGVLLKIVLKPLQLQLKHRWEVAKEHALSRILHK